MISGLRVRRVLRESLKDTGSKLESCGQSWAPSSICYDEPELGRREDNVRLVVTSVEDTKPRPLSRYHLLVDCSYAVLVGIPVKVNVVSGGKPNGVPERR